MKCCPLETEERSNEVSGASCHDTRRNRGASYGDWPEAPLPAPFPSSTWHPSEMLRAQPHIWHQPGHETGRRSPCHLVCMRQGDAARVTWFAKRPSSRPFPDSRATSRRQVSWPLLWVLPRRAPSVSWAHPCPYPIVFGPRLPFMSPSACWARQASEALPKS